MGHTGKTFIIAGASSGIGLALAKRLLDSGDQVIGISRTSGPLDGIELYSHHVVDFSGEFSLPELSGPVHGLIYCPGTINLKPAERLRPTDIDTDFRINAGAAFRFVQHYLPVLRESGDGCILFFSTVAVQTGMPFHSSIAMAKGAVEGLTRALAAELAPAIRVNCIAPSLTDTPLAKGLLNTETKKQSADDRHPMKRVGSAADHAALAEYLLKNGSWITGQVIGSNGGLGTVIR